MSIFGPTPPQIWSYRPRDIRLAQIGWYTLSNKRFALTDWQLAMHSTSTPDAAALERNVAGPGLEAVETTRLNEIWYTSIFGSGTVMGYLFRMTLEDLYVDTLGAGTPYHYKTYIQPVYLNAAGAVVNMEAERLADTVDHAPAGGAGWEAAGHDVYVLMQVGPVALAFNGILGLRIRLTSWTTAGGGARSDHGYRELNNPSAWTVGFNYQMD